MLSFEKLYADHSERVYRYALHLSGNEAQARDIVSETFFRVWTAPTPVRMDTVRAYLCTIARNVFLTQCRTDRRLVPIEAAADVAESAPDPEARAERLDLRQGLQALPEGLRSALSLVVWDELSHAEAARVLGIGVSAVKMRVARAKLELAKQMKQEMTK